LKRRGEQPPTKDACSPNYKHSTVLSCGTEGIASSRESLPLGTP
jgi:hypothetical protein